MEKLAYFAGILLKNLGQISPEYEKKFTKKNMKKNFLGNERKKLVLRCFHKRF